MLDLISNRAITTRTLLDHRHRRADTRYAPRTDGRSGDGDSHGGGDAQGDGDAHGDGDALGHELPRCLDRSLRSTKPSVSVVVPTLNESRNLPYAMWRLPDFVTEVIVVDGRSSDDTATTAAKMRPDVRVVMEPAKGKGAALRRGFAEATGDIVVMLDADGSADGAEIQRFVDVLLAGADFAKGSRFLPGGGSADLTHIRSLGNQALTAMVNLICQTRFSDLCYGFNAFWRDCLDFIDVDVTGFEVETRLTMMVASAGLIVVEVPSWEYNRVHGVSNLNAVSDGVRVLRSIWSTTREIRNGRASVRGQALGDHCDT